MESSSKDDHLTLCCRYFFLMSALPLPFHLLSSSGFLFKRSSSSLDHSTLLSPVRSRWRALRSPETESSLWRMAGRVVLYYSARTLRRVAVSASVRGAELILVLPLSMESIMSGKPLFELPRPQIIVQSKKAASQKNDWGPPPPGNRWPNTLLLYSTIMGKKVKKAVQEEVPVQQQPEMEVQPPQKQQPLEKWLPFDKYLNRVSKALIRKRKEAIDFVKLDKNQVNSAISCLKEFIEKHRNVQDLFQGVNDGFVYLQVDLAEVPWKHSVRPIQIQLPNPIYSEAYNSRFAIFTTDPQEAFISSIQDLQLPLLSQAIGYDRAKKHFRNNKEKLKLLNSNDAFFCDWKIYNLLRKPLGKLFYQKKKFPFPIDCEGVPEHLKDKFKNYQEYLNDLMSYTYTMLGNGPVYTLKVGRLDMSNPDLVKNVMQGAYRFISHICEQVGIDQIRQISLKGYNSPSLPIYNYISPKEMQTYLANKDELLQLQREEQKNV